MTCHKCHAPTEVIDSRPSGETVRRRRRCTKCGARFSTLEVLAGQAPRLDAGVLKVTRRDLSRVLRMLAADAPPRGPDRRGRPEKTGADEFYRCECGGLIRPGQEDEHDCEAGDLDLLLERVGE